MIMKLDDELNNLKNNIPECNLNPTDIYKKSLKENKKKFPMKLVYISFAFVLIIVSLSIILPNVITTDYTKYASLIEEISDKKVEEKPESYNEFINKYNNFACRVTDIILHNQKQNNTLISTYAIFSNLALLSLVSNSNTKKQILDTLEMSEDLIIENYPYFYSKNNQDKELSFNSLWIQKGLLNKKDGLNILTNITYYRPYYIDFTDNINANKCINQYVCDNNDAHIYDNFNLKEDTLTALINLSYINVTWKHKLSKNASSFTNIDGNVVRKTFNVGEYQKGIMKTEDNYSHFYDQTSNNKIKYILPNDGINITDIFNNDVIAHVNNYNYKTISDDNKTLYYTRCIFPNYKLESDVIDVKEYLTKGFGITDSFNSNAEISKLFNNSICIDDIKHKNILEFSDTGIKAPSIALSDNSEYYSLVINKSFGIIVTNMNNEIIYTGIVNKL